MANDSKKSKDQQQKDLHELETSVSEDFDMDIEEKVRRLFSMDNKENVNNSQNQIDQDYPLSAKRNEQHKRSSFRWNE